MAIDNNLSTKIAIFRSRQIRKTIYNNEWWFSVVDIVAALTDSVNPRDYWFKMKIRVKSEDGIELSIICRLFLLFIKFFRSWLQAKLSHADVKFSELIGMWRTSKTPLSSYAIMII